MKTIRVDAFLQFIHACAHGLCNSHTVKHVTLHTHVTCSITCIHVAYIAILYMSELTQKRMCMRIFTIYAKRHTYCIQTMHSNTHMHTHRSYTHEEAYMNFAVLVVTIHTMTVTLNSILMAFKKVNKMLTGDSTLIKSLSVIRKTQKTQISVCTLRCETQ